MTAAGPACSKCGKGWGVWLGPDESPCQCAAQKPDQRKVKEPSVRQEHVYRHHRKFNGLFRSVDDTLARKFSHAQRVLIMDAVWPAVQDIAGKVIQRTMDDLLGANQRAKDAKEFAPG